MFTPLQNENISYAFLEVKKVMGHVSPLLTSLQVSKALLFPHLHIDEKKG